MPERLRAPQRTQRAMYESGGRGRKNQFIDCRVDLGKLTAFAPVIG
jgi:hypothetical protein